MCYEYFVNVDCFRQYKTESLILKMILKLFRRFCLIIFLCAFAAKLLFSLRSFHLSAFGNKKWNADYYDSYDLNR